MAASTYVLFTPVQAGHRLPFPTEIYRGRELATRPARASANNAFEHPSRRGDRLHWPDGRVTDLNGIELREFVNQQVAA